MKKKKEEGDQKPKYWPCKYSLVYLNGFFSVLVKALSRLYLTVFARLITDKCFLDKSAFQISCFKQCTAGMWVWSFYVSHAYLRDPESDILSLAIQA